MSAVLLYPAGGAARGCVCWGWNMKHETLPCPRCIVIAGPNGAGKTTFAREFLPKDAGVVHFVNADLIAGGLSPLRPENAAVAAGRLFLNELDRLAKARVDFAFETTLSGLVYLARLRRWKAAGYRIEIVFLRLPSPRLGLRRIAARVRQGGHDVPRADVLRRFARGWDNFQTAYRPLADAWAVYDNSGKIPGCWSKHHDYSHPKTTGQNLRGGGGPGAAPRRPDGAQNRPRPWHPGLLMAQRQGGCPKTVTGCGE